MSQNLGLKKDSGETGSGKEVYLDFFLKSKHFDSKPFFFGQKKKEKEPTHPSLKLKTNRKSLFEELFKAYWPIEVEIHLELVEGRPSKVWWKKSGNQEGFRSKVFLDRRLLQMFGRKSQNGCFFLFFCFVSLLFGSFWVDEFMDCTQHIVVFFVFFVFSFSRLPSSFSLLALVLGFGS